MYVTIRFSKKVLCAIFAILLVAVSSAIILYNVDFSAEEDDDHIELPIIMYHGLLKDKKLQGKYVISPDDFERDVKYLKEKGFTTIFVKDLIDYVYEDAPLPENPIMLTFDDGYYNNYLYAFPILQKYEAKMVLSAIGKYADFYSKTDNAHACYAHASWDNINEMLKSGLVELQNHSYNMHVNSGRNGAKKKFGESLDTYKKIFTEDVMKMQECILKNTGTQATAFTYPFGAVSNVSVEILKELGFKATLTCEQKSNKICKDPECLFGLNRFLRPNNISTEEYFKNTLGINSKCD